MARTSLSKIGVYVAVVSVGLTSSARAADVWILPGQPIQPIVDQSPAGTTFRLLPGLWRQQTISPKAGDTFRGQPGTVLSGATVLVGWAKTVCGERPCWGVPQVQDRTGGGECEDGAPHCAHPYDVWVDGVRQQHRDGPTLQPGDWRYDAEAQRVLVGRNPHGRTVEASVTAYAFDSDGACASGVSIIGLTIERYANPAQTGAVHCPSGADWRIVASDVRENHGGGIELGPRRRILRSRVTANGQIGIRGVGDDVLVAGSEIAWNNQAGYAPGWEAGGTKFWATHNLVVRGNWVHHNDGPGLWTDTDNLDALIEDNRVVANTRPGIFHEISYRAVIRHNVVLENGWGSPGWGYGAGILVAGSPDVEVSGNRVAGNADGIMAIQQQRGSGAYGPYEVHHLWVHDNDITMASGWTGLAQDVGDWRYFLDFDNRFTGNRYRLDDPQGLRFTWFDQELTYDAFNGLPGIDEGGIVPQ